MANNEKKFGLGLLFGAVAGALAGVFLAPKSGKKNREEFLKRAEELKEKLYEAELDKKIKTFVGEVTDETKKAYFDVKKVTIKNLAELQDKIEDIDREKYFKIVKSAVEQVKEKHSVSEEVFAKLKTMLESDWVKLTQTKKTVKKTVKKTKKS